MSDLKADTGSMVVSYLWTRRGEALAAELAMALQRPDVPSAVALLERNGWVDLVREELPAVRLTQEALAALGAHVNFGVPLSEVLERAADRERRVREAQAGASVELVTMIRELRAEQAENRRLMLELAQAKGLPLKAAPQIDMAACTCGTLFFPGTADGSCGRCGKART